MKNPKKLSKNEETRVGEDVKSGIKSVDGQGEKSVRKGKGKNKAEVEYEVAPEYELQSTTGSKVSSKKYQYVIRNKRIRRHSSHRKAVMIMMVLVAIGLLMGGGVYGVMTLIEYNNFRIVVDQNGKSILSLSPTDNFDQGKEVLALYGPNNLDNVSYISDIGPIMDKIRDHQGTYTSKQDKFLASTFFLKNVTNEKQTYVETVSIKYVTKEMDSALRILVINDTGTQIYAKTAVSGLPEEVCPGQDLINPNTGKVWMTEPFANNNTIYQVRNLTLSPGEVKKYTFVLWLEGWDNECVNAILGGTMNLDINFSIA